MVSVGHSRFELFLNFFKTLYLFNLFIEFYNYISVRLEFLSIFRIKKILRNICIKNPMGVWEILYLLG